ncbi:MAG: TIM barrel protein, partial [Clostridia bacterium]|nr:TIM barrel protein [Clostridia bacterium]
MKTCVSSFIFGGDVYRLGLVEVIKKAAQMGFEGIEFVEGAWTQGLDKNIARECRRTALDAGLESVSYCIGADFLYGSGGDLQKEVDRVKQQVDFAAELGVKNMRHDVAYGMRPLDGKKAGLGYDNALPRIAEGCRLVTEYAETLGVGTMTENHGYFSQDAQRVE